ncbi:hypothetical protein K2X85_13110 [bacterium]|nr:hypothetical protein [bacterium]
MDFLQSDTVLLTSFFVVLVVALAVRNYGWSSAGLGRGFIALLIIGIEHAVQAYRTATEMESLPVNLFLHTSPFWMVFVVSDWKWREIPPVVAGLLAACINSWELFFVAYVTAMFFRLGFDLGSAMFDPSRSKILFATCWPLVSPRRFFSELP